MENKKSVQIGEEISLVADSKKVLYESDGFHIVSFATEYKPDKFPEGFPQEKGEVEFVAKGHFSAPDYVGQTIELVGEWRYDNKYKKLTFFVQYTIPSLPNTDKGAVAFLKTIKGIGAKLAQRICDEYKGNLESAASDEDSLTASVKGMTASRAAEVCKTIRRVNASAELTRLLKDTVLGETIRRIAIKYGDKALDAVKTPYEMVIKRVISFHDADAVALALGWSKEDDARIEAAIISSIRTLKGRSIAIIVDKRALHRMVVQTLGIEESLITAMYQKLMKSRTIVSAKDYCYLGEDYETEKGLATKVATYVTSPVPTGDAKRYDEKFKVWKQTHPDMNLAENQELAVKAVAQNHLSVVTGGPGTGKTTVLKAIMETYKMTFPSSPVTLMAPTGLASKRMGAACGMEAKTIHKALGLIPSECDAGFDDSNGLSIVGGLIVIDEFSMVGIHLAKFLFDAIVFKPDVRVVIVGDVDQLPPVSPGAVLDDFISCGEVKVTRLNRNFRQEAGSAIIDGAYAINAGNTNLNFTGNFLFDEIYNKDIDIETNNILERLKVAFVESIKKFGLAQTYVLAPQRKAEIKDGKTTTRTLLSTVSLNPILRDIANPPVAGKNFYKSGSRIFREGDRVINLKNTEEVMNGEIGIVDSIVTVDVPIITVDYDGMKVEYTPDKLKQLDLAYAVTVHKSQGCEYKSVLYPTSMTQEVMLQRNLLYTAVTRAKSQVLIIGDRESLIKAITTKKDKAKRDFLSARIAKMVRQMREYQVAV